MPLIRNPGMFHYRDGGEEHLNSPMAMVSLQQVSPSAFMLMHTYNLTRSVSSFVRSVFLYVYTHIHIH